MGAGHGLCTGRRCVVCLVPDPNFQVILLMCSGHRGFTTGLSIIIVAMRQRVGGHRFHVLDTNTELMNTASPGCRNTADRYTVRHHLAHRALPAEPHLPATHLSIRDSTA